MGGCAAGGAGPVGSPAQPTVASPATGGAGGSAKTAQTKKQAQLTGFSSKETETKSEAPAPAPKTKEHAAAAKQARQLIAAAQTKLSSRASPDKIKIVWLPGEEGVKARVRGSKEVVEVFNPAPPLTYYKRKNGRATVPKDHLRCVSLGFMHILLDGAERFARGDGDLLCGSCFTVHRMPKHGEENLRTHMASAACGAKGWAAAVTDALAKEKTHDRRRVQISADGTVIDTETKMMFNIETALMFAEIGSLPASLFDHPSFINWTSTITRGAWLPPSKQWLDPERGPIMDLAFGGVMTAMKELIAQGLEFYKGVGFLHLTFDCWTSRIGHPFLGSDLSLNAPWLVSRENMHAPFVGEFRRLLTLPLIHLTGSHTGVRIALAIAAALHDFGIFSVRKVIVADDYDAHTDVSAMIKTACTDSGGGVPAACRRLGRPHKKCGLHGLGSVLGRICGLAYASSTLPADLLAVKLLFKKVFALAAYFHRGDHVQRVAEHRAVQSDQKAIEAAVRLFEEIGINDAAGDGFMDVEIDDIAAEADDTHFWRHIVNG